MSEEDEEEDEEEDNEDNEDNDPVNSAFLKQCTEFLCDFCGVAIALFSHGCGLVSECHAIQKWFQCHTFP